MVLGSLGEKWIWKEIKSVKSSLWFAVGATTVANILQILISLFVMAVYNKVIPNEALTSLLTLAGGVCVLIMFDWGFKHVKSRLVDEAAQRVEVPLQRRLYSKVLSWDLQSRPKFSGSMTTLVRDIESIIELFTGSSVTTLVGLPFVFINLFVIWAIAGPLAGVTGVICLVTLVTSYLYFMRVSALAEEAKARAVDKNSVFLETVSNLETLKSIGEYGYFESKWDHAESASRSVDKELKLALADASSINSTISSAGQVVLVALGAYLVITGETTTGALIAAVMLNGRTNQPDAQLAGLLQKISTARVAMDRLNGVMQAMSSEELRRKNIRLPRVEPPIIVDKLAFQPPGTNAPILAVDRLRLQLGEHVGIVGSVGSGKSTLLKLIGGILTPSEGTVSFGTFDTTAIHQADLRRDIAYLGQSPGVFGGSIRENIALSNQALDDETLLKILAVTGLDKILKRIPNGLSFEMSESGRELSGGQKQILALTRAIASDPSVLLLDEPTSAMDPTHEHQFIAHMEQFIPGRTLIVVTHRKPILNLTTRMLVIENGRVVMDGPTPEVMGRFK